MKRIEGILVLISLLYANARGFAFGNNQMAGKYFVKTTFIRAVDASETPGTSVRYTIEKTKLSRYVEGVKGFINVTENIKGPIGAKMKCMKRSTGGTGLMNIMLDKVAADNICKAEAYFKFMQKFKPDFWDDDCGFRKGVYYLDPPFNMDHVIHEYCNESMYGDFEFKMLWYDADGKPIIGYDIGLNFMTLTQAQAQAGKKSKDDDDEDCDDDEDDGDDNDSNDKDKSKAKGKGKGRKAKGKTKHKQ